MYSDTYVFFVDINLIYQETLLDLTKTPPVPMKIGSQSHPNGTE